MMVRSSIAEQTLGLPPGQQWRLLSRTLPSEPGAIWPLLQRLTMVTTVTPLTVIPPDFGFIFFFVNCMFRGILIDSHQPFLSLRTCPLSNSKARHKGRAGATWGAPGGLRGTSQNCQMRTPFLSQYFSSLLKYQSLSQTFHVCGSSKPLRMPPFLREVRPQARSLLQARAFLRM